MSRQSADEVIAMQSLVSVIIPCYNRVALLAEAIESALRQRCGRLEILVVDDGSREDVASVVARYEGVRYVRQRNRGVSAARNHGFALCTGDFVLFLDNDDVLAVTALCDQLGAFARHPAAIAAAGLSRVVNGSRELLPFKQEGPFGTDLYSELLVYNRIWNPAQVLYRRDAFAACGGFDPSIDSCADYDLYLRLAMTGPVVCHRSVVVDYRFHDSNMSSNTARMLRDTLKVLDRQPHWVETSPRHRLARERGRAFWRGLYGDRLVDELRDQVRTRDLGRQFARGLVTLLRYYPYAVTRNIKGKARSLWT
jgi:glycosyltransferase involved in cell wall biosynthesis